MSLWPHQQRALDELDQAMSPGSTICLAAATGMGKTRMMVELLKRGQPTALYTNRRMLLDQTASVLEANGIRFGVRAAGHVTDFTKPIQLCSIQTTDSRTLKSKKWPLPQVELALIDEAHVNKEATMVEIIRRHHEQGARVIGFTATPLNIGHVYDQLILAGQPSEGRACGALVPALHFAPDEPDTAKIKRTKTGEFTYGEIVKAVMTHSILGRVIGHWITLNPTQAPTLLFAPGVAESLWFAEQLCYPEKREHKEDRVLPAIPAAHIDGDRIWINGELHESDQWQRDRLKELCRSGEVKIVCNRFVMREGIDWPFISHIVIATIFGALTSYIQSVGRGLRACAGKDNLTIQDHGGAWWRHGSVNSDREWVLDRTDYIVGEMREHRLREKKEVEPILCPKCHAVRASGPACKNCGFAHTTKTRMVVQHDGKLREMQGDIFKPKRKDHRPKAVDIWQRIYYRCKKKDMTFNQARGLYQYENNWLCPPEGLPLMPMHEADWFLPISQVPFERLHFPQGGRREAVA